MKKSFFVILVFATLIVISFAFVSADKPIYKNLKVLKKNISKQELDSVMHFFAVSLGEKCNFCHVWNNETKKMDFVTDENPNKNVARYMMKMANKLNKKYFKDQDKNSTETIQAVTCYTCHHGSTDPAVKAPKKELPGQGSGSPFRSLTDSTKH